jgi:hypothetical protein
MDDAPETLPPVGELKDWAVKQFPVAMRLAITAAAERRNMTVAQFLIRHFETHGIDGDLPPSTALTVVGQPGNRSANGSELRELVQIAREATPDGKDSEAMRLARSMVRDRLRALRM